MALMFCDCNKLKEIKGMNKFITNNVKDMTSMFQSCKELCSLDLSNFDTSNVINICEMFYECNKLKKIKGIEALKTKNVKKWKIYFVYVLN